jgi:hypothetical protein
MSKKNIFWRQLYHLNVPVVLQSWSLNLLEHSGLVLGRIAVVVVVVVVVVVAVVII